MQANQVMTLLPKLEKVSYGKILESCREEVRMIFQYRRMIS